MVTNNRLPREFFERHTVQVARGLLGSRLVRLDSGKRISGVIIEAEAYRGEEDLGCHAKAGRTPRTQVMYGPPGHAYVYFTYGMHWMLNFVTEAAGFPAAVLVRAIMPVEGLDLIASRRQGRPPALWTDGPAKICQALGIDGSLNGADLCASGADLWVETGDNVPDSAIATSSRVGLYTVPEPWKSIHWRLFVNKDLFSTTECTESTEIR